MNTRLLTMSLLLALIPAIGWSRDKASEQRELRLNRAKWEHCGIASYDIRLRDETCWCPPPGSGPFRVSVKGGKVRRVIYEGQKGGGYWRGRVVPEKDYGNTDLIATVEEVFARAQKVINSHPEPSSFGPQYAPHKIRYDPVYGFPILIDVDNPPRIADSQWRLIVDGFRPTQ